MEIFGDRLRTSNAIRYLLFRAGFDFKSGVFEWQTFDAQEKKYNTPTPLSQEQKQILDDPNWFRKIKRSRIVCTDTIQEFLISAPYPCLDGIWIKKRVLGLDVPCLSNYYIEDQVVYCEKILRSSS